MKKSGKKISFFKKLPNNHGTPLISVGRRDKTKEVEVEQFKVRYTILFDFVLNCHLSSIIISD